MNVSILVFRIKYMFQITKVVFFDIKMYVLTPKIVGEGSLITKEPSKKLIDSRS